MKIRVALLLYSIYYIMQKDLDIFKQENKLIKEQLISQQEFTKHQEEFTRHLEVALASECSLLSSPTG